MGKVVYMVMLVILNYLGATNVLLIANLGGSGYVYMCPGQGRPEWWSP